MGMGSPLPKLQMVMKIIEKYPCIQPKYIKNTFILRFESFVPSLDSFVNFELHPHLSIMQSNYID